MNFTSIGDSAITLSLEPDHIDPATFADALKRAAVPGVIDVVPAFGTVTIEYDVAQLPGNRGALDWLREKVEHIAQATRGSKTPRQAQTIELPVEYGGEAGPDLAALAESLKFTANQIIALHADARYTVAAVGFLPGFAYLDGLPDVLRVPRRATPRTRVPSGSVALGGPYTGVYPAASAGGWHIIGRTRAKLFDPTNPLGTPWRVGDLVRFCAK